MNKIAFLAGYDPKERLTKLAFLEGYMAAGMEKEAGAAGALDDLVRGLKTFGGYHKIKGNKLEHIMNAIAKGEHTGGVLKNMNADDIIALRNLMEHGNWGEVKKLAGGHMDDTAAAMLEKTYGSYHPLRNKGLGKELEAAKASELKMSDDMVRNTEANEAAIEEALTKSKSSGLMGLAGGGALGFGINAAMGSGSGGANREYQQASAQYA